MLAATFILLPDQTVLANGFIHEDINTSRSHFITNDGDLYVYGTGIRGNGTPMNSNRREELSVF